MAIVNKFTCIIPARYKSSRFPGKPLVDIEGKSMISRVWHNANNADMIERAIVATDDERIYDHCKSEECEVVYTSSDCNDGSARVAEVAEGIDTPYIFELQGDQPLVDSRTIDYFLNHAREDLIKNPAIDIVQPFASATQGQVQSADVVKVAVSRSNKMLLITREAIQSEYRTLGLYLWKKATLLNFQNMKVTDYERAEKCHLLRFFLNDLYVQGVFMDGEDWVEVDREEDVLAVKKLIKKI